ncbi:MAG: oligosaccharide flippase family protein [Candidatus Marinimicrobia bacterium]|nr:oligosaccharide flippase family protein [Candidatus Neomarinimicrobiota bacterium]
MNYIKQTVRSFTSRGGHFVFSSMIISKLSNFVLSILIIRILAESVYGNISYAFSIMQVLVTLSGMGLHHALLRFGALEKSLEEKNDLFMIFVKYGTVISLILGAVLFFSSDAVSTKMPGAAKFLQMFSPLLFTFFLAEIIFSYFRIQKNNRLYSAGMIIKSLLFLAVCYTATLLSGGQGYVIAYTLVPLMTAGLMYFFAKRLYHIGMRSKKQIDIKPHLKYGFWVAAGNIASQLIILLDVIMVGNIIADSTQVATYKVATLIPLNLLFIPMVLLRTDYVYIAEKYQNRVFLINYYKKYFVIFVSMLIVIFILWFLLADIIMGVFGAYYIKAKPLVTILLFMVVASFLFRIPLGNMLAAVGKSKWNGISNIILVFINFALNLLLIPRYGLIGGAVATVTSIWISSVISIGMFSYYLSKYCKKA